jgi:catalase
MAMRNPTGRANYEPNSWPGEAGGPREDPQRGFTTVPEQVDGTKRRLRPESFADHYSQARQFWVSQTDVERSHIAAAFVFELSKCDRGDIRERMVAGLQNVDGDLAQRVADGLGLAALPDRVPPAREPISDPPASPALSIVRNGPDSFAGRKLGILLGDGVDAAVLNAVRTEAQRRGVTVELVADTVGGVVASDGNRVAAEQRVDGAPSVLYDAVVLATGADGAQQLRNLPAARDFVSDAFAHCKFIGYSESAAELFDAVGLADSLDEGTLRLSKHADVAGFFDACDAMRYWPRQATLA